MAKAKVDYAKGVMILLENVTVNYPHLHPDRPDTKFGAEWSLLAEVSDTDATRLMADGFNVKDGNRLKLSKKVMTRDGKAQSPPKIVGRDGRTPVDPDEVGPGSIVNVQIFCKKFPVGTFVSAYIDAIQVLEAKATTGLFKPVD